MPNITVTANGQVIDMEALKMQNEKSVAVGNMKVNARGDEVSSNTGEVSRTRNQRMTDYYRLHTTVPVKRPRAVAEPEPEVVVEQPAMTEAQMPKKADAAKVKNKSSSDE